MRDIPIGTDFCYGKIKLRVEATPYNTPSCAGCFFSNSYRDKRKIFRVSCHIHKMACTKSMRKDRHHVIFKNLEDE